VLLRAHGHYSTEETFGEALTQLGTSGRAQMQLITKCGIRLTTHRRPGNRLKSYDTSREYIVASAERSLKNLRTDYIDLFLIHRPDPLMDPAEVAAAFDDLRTSGASVISAPASFHCSTAVPTWSPTRWNATRSTPVYFMTAPSTRCWKKESAPWSGAP